MPRPRFENLAPERRAAILAVAAEEFAEHGYEAASFNRIIERSGLSKGAIYYYFDDKEDLYATVLRDALQRFVVDVGQMSEPTDVPSWWAAFEVWYVRSLRALQADPHAVGLARSLVKAVGRGAAPNVLPELRRYARTWMDAFIAQGQALGAIRRDIPNDLLTSVLMGLEEGIDLWLGERIGAMSTREIEATATMLTGVYRSVAQPPAAPDGDRQERRERAPGRPSRSKKEKK